MTAAACLTAAMAYGFIWWRQRAEWAYLLFTIAALATAGLAGCDLALLQAASPAQYNFIARWAHLSVWLFILPLAGFVRLYLHAGRMWLLFAVCALRTLALLLNFTTGKNLNYLEISNLSHVPFLGESVVSIAAGVPNPWMFIGQLSLWALIIFVFDAAISAWRQGDRRRAVSVGGSILFFLIAGTAQTALIVWGNVQWPVTPSLFFLGIIVAMGSELGSEALRAAELSRELGASQRRMALAAEAAKLVFWSRDFARDEIQTTGEWRALFGFSETDCITSNHVLQRVHPDDRDIARQMFAAPRQGSSGYQGEYRVLLADGRVRWIATQGSVELNNRGQPVRFEGVSLDITHRKMAEAEAHAHRSEVAHLLRVASIGELSSALAHELSQPLTAILNNAQAAELFLASDRIDLDEIREIIRDIVMDDKRASEVVVRLRGLLKKGEFLPQRLEPNELIQDVLKLVHPDFVAREIRVVTELSAGLPSIRGDRVELQQVLINLILNAGDAMRQSAERTLIVRSIRPESNIIQIAVADTGGGIPPGSELKIFEPYHTTKSQRLGLGLSLSRSIVFAHGGRIWAENQTSGGAVFHFTVPEWKNDSR